MKRCSMSVIIREMKIRTTVRYHLTPVSVIIINKSPKSVDKDVEKEEPSCTVGGNADWCSHYGKQYRDTSKIKMELPDDLAVPLLGIYMGKSKTLI